MPRLGLITLPALALAALSAAPASARDKNDAATAPPPAFQAVLDCQKLADPGLRLACFDRAVGTMAQATAKKDLVIIDRESIRATKRGLFGISLPRIKMFGGNDDVEVNQIESTITATSSRNGFSIFALADGSKWEQTDGRFTYPKAGQKILVKRGALGGFMARVDGQADIRVIRIIPR